MRVSYQSHEALGDANSGQASAAGGGYGPPGGYGAPPGGYGAPPGGYGPPGGTPPPGGGFGPPPGGYGAPPGAFGPPGYGPPGSNAEAEGKVKAPAIIMIVCSAIGILVQLVGVLTNIIGTGIGIGNAEYSQLASGAVGIVFGIIAICVSSFCIFGLVKMMKLESRSLSYTAVILSMIPCLGSCWCLNLFIGVWALVVLSDQQVRVAFRS